MRANQLNWMTSIREERRQTIQHLPLATPNCHCNYHIFDRATIPTPHQHTTPHDNFTVPLLSGQLRDEEDVLGRAHLVGPMRATCEIIFIKYN